MEDLFGNVIEEQREKSFEERYKDYINSAAWKRLRDAKIEEVGGVCERCGLSKWSVTLSAHHKNYDNFMHERMDDLEVLCPDCHGKADDERKESALEKRINSSVVKGFEKWMDKGNNRGWRNYSDSILGRIWKDFLRDLGKRTGKRYEIPFWRSPDWHY